MSNAVINAQQQQGEPQILTVITEGTTLPGAVAAADGTILSNISGASALMANNTLLAVTNKAPAKTAVTAVSALATPLTAITIALSTGDTYTDAAVNTAVNTALASAVSDMQLLVTKVNALLAAIKTVA